MGEQRFLKAGEVDQERPEGSSKGKGLSFSDCGSIAPNSEFRTHNLNHEEGPA